MIAAWILVTLAFVAGLVWTYRAACHSPNPSLSPAVWAGLAFTLLALGTAFILVIVMAP